MILITGSSSYLAKNLIQFFEENNIKYIGIDKQKPYNRNCLKIDILNKDLSKIIKKKITKIVHLAAISSDQVSKKNINLCYNTNIFGTVNLINFAKKNNIKKFIFASTEWVYGDFKKKKSHKSKIVISKLKSHYAITKAICEKIILNTRLNYSILRFGIIYGNKKNNYSAVESIVYQVKNKRIITINSKKTARSFVHIFDIIKSIKLSLDYKKKGIFDIQGSKLISLEQIIKITSKFLNKKVTIFEIDKNRPSRRSINSYISHKKLKFIPKISINDGINFILKNE